MRGVLTRGGDPGLAQRDQPGLVGDVHRRGRDVPDGRVRNEYPLRLRTGVGRDHLPGNVVRLALVPHRARVRVQHGWRVDITSFERDGGCGSGDLEEDAEEGENEEEDGGRPRTHSCRWRVGS